MVARKSALTWTGSCGVAVWRIGETQKRLVIMWGVPWWASNTLSIGITEGKVEPGKEVYDEMYCEEDGDTWFKCQAYAKDQYAPPVVKKDKSIKYMVQGTMGTEGKCTATVQLLPLTKDMVAESLKHVVE